MTGLQTSISLLQQAQSGQDGAWKRLMDLYQPLIGQWAQRQAQSHHDAEDLAQEILIRLLRSLPRFEHNGRPGAFRCWLRIIAIQTTRDHWAVQGKTAKGTGDTAVMARLEQLEDPTSDLTKGWDQEHDHFVLHRLLETVALEFEPKSMAAFRRLALDGMTGEAIARELDLSVGAVYTAKSRIMQRLRELSTGLLDWGEGDSAETLINNV